MGNEFRVRQSRALPHAGESHGHLQSEFHERAKHSENLPGYFDEVEGQSSVRNGTAGKPAWL